MFAYDSEARVGRLGPVLLAGAAVIGLFLPSPCAAKLDKLDEQLPKAAKSLAAEIKSYLKSATDVPVVVDPIRSRDDKLPASGANLTNKLRQMLRKELEGAKISVLDGTNAKGIVVTGDFETISPAPGGPSVYIYLAAFDNRKPGRKASIADYTPIITDLADISTTSGLTVTTGASTQEAAQEKVRESIDGKVAPFIGDAKTGEKGVVARSDEDSPYGLAIVVEGKPLPIRLEGNLLFVDVQKGDKIGVQLINDSKFDAGATLTLDGVNSFAFSEVVHGKDGPPQNNDWWLPPNEPSPRTVKGWYKGPSSFAPFVLTDNPADTAVSKVFGPDKGDPKEVGTITAIFKGAWPSGQEPPEGLGEPKEGGKGANPPIAGIGIGPVQQQNFETKALTFGVIRSSVTIRYLKNPAPAEKTADAPKTDSK